MIVMDYKGSNRLARVLQGRMQGIAEQPQVLDTGMINADGSLTCSTYPVSIPAADYMVCRGAAHRETVFGQTVQGSSIPLPASMAAIKPGDSVLVAWASNMAVVIDILVPAGEVTG